jgi:hypothetical protein
LRYYILTADVMDVVSPKENQNKKSQLDSQKRQNLIVSALVFIGFSAMVLGVFQIFGTISSPLSSKEESGDTSQNALVNSDSEYDQLVFLKEKDTDQDGLNDYDELYIYGTSPYVADSDSDNISDKDELDSGNDPNCPKGETCIITTVATEPDTDVADTTTSTTSNLSAAELRDTLKQLGAPANIVDAMDDETLKTVYEETVVETGIDPQNLSGETDDLAPTETASQEITVEALQKLDAAQIRQLLLSSGVSEADLSQVDDETLELLYSQALQEELY